MARLVTKVLTCVVALACVAAAVLWGPELWHRYSDRLFSAEKCTATVDGMSDTLTAEQADNAALVIGIAISRGLPKRAGVVALATALQESDLRNLRVGDRDSLGLFQQRPSQGWGTEKEVLDPHHATNAFYDALVGVDGWESMDVTEAAQSVQRSGFPEAYARHELRAEVWANALWGEAGIDAISCFLEPASSESSPDLAFLGRSAEDYGGILDSRCDRSTPNLVVVVLVADPSLRDALANWSVAVASTHSVVAVSSCGREWTRDKGVWDTSQSDPYPTGCAPGEVYVVLAADQAEANA